MQVIFKAEYKAVGPKGFSPTLSGIQCKLRGKCIWSLVTDSWLVEAHPVTSLCTLLPEVVVELTQAGEQHCLMVFSICPISSGGWRLYTLLVWNVLRLLAPTGNPHMLPWQQTASLHCSWCATLRTCVRLPTQSEGTLACLL